MERIFVNGVELLAEASGAGEPVLLIPNLPEVWRPVLNQSVLSDHFRLITYHLRNTGQSTHDAHPTSFGLHASDALALLRHFDIGRAHIAGHSFGGAIAIRLALDNPEAVHSLALLEPAGMPVDPSLMAALEPAFAELGRRDAAKFWELFADVVLGSEGRQAYDQEMPIGWFEQQVADINWQLEQNLQVVPELEFNEEIAHRITQPVLAVQGEDSHDLFRGGQQLLLKWLPNVEPLVLPRANHALQVMNPRGLAEGLAAFFLRHPMTKPQS